MRGRIEGELPWVVDPVHHVEGRHGQPGGVEVVPGVEPPHRWALAEAFRFHLDIGRDRVAARTHEQVTRLKEGLAGIDGISLVTPPGEDMSSGIVCFDVDGESPHDVVARLAAAGFSTSVTPYREQHVRAGPSIVTTPDEVDALLDELRR